jgi:L-gulonate 5-dehydrogenase
MASGGLAVKGVSMREARTVSRRTIVVGDAPDAPPPAAGEARLRVAAAGICGSDLHMYLGDDPYTTYPIRQGHEFSGWIEALGPGYEGPLHVGQLVAVQPLLPCHGCVACRRGRPNCCVRLRVYGAHLDGAFAERVTVPVVNLYAAADLTPEEAAFAEPVSIGLQMLHRSGLTAGDTALVIGAGPIGQSILLAARDRGARLIAADRLAARLDLALQTGADDVIDVSQVPLADAIRSLTDDEGPTVVLEATGVAAVMEQALDVVAASGTVVIAGTPTESISIPAMLLVGKEVNLHGSRNNQGTYQDAVDVVRRNRERVARLITHRWSLESLQEAMETAIANPGETQKMMMMVGRA